MSVNSNFFFFFLINLKIFRLFTKHLTVLNTDDMEALC